MKPRRSGTRVSVVALSLLAGIAAGCGSDSDGESAGADGIGVDGIGDRDGVSDADETVSVPDAADADDDGGPSFPEDVALDGDVEPGTFGAPCQGNVDCFSGWCVEGPEGYICTSICEETCPAGFDCKAVQNQTDVTFLCVPRLDKLCAPCTQDIHCNGGACLEIDGRDSCTFACSEPGDCPEGWTCGEDPTGDAAGSWCLPGTGSCTCNADVNGGQRTCTNANEIGTCFGVETCEQDTGWSACTAAEAEPEVCDGTDNDCNGLADDGLSEDTTCEIANDFGTCTGTRACVGSQGWVCDAREPSAEACNGQDDDCDGEVDEDFKAADGTWTTDAHCGGCGNACADRFPNATGTCGGTEELPRCVVDTCDEGLVKVNDFLCSPPLDSSCTPCDSDADCFGGSCATLDGEDVCVGACGDEGTCPTDFTCQEISDGVERCVPDSGSCSCNTATGGAKRTCSVENPIGTCFGVETCDPGTGWSACTAAVPEVETCDGQDNDCNGLIDDGVAQGNPCANEVEGVGSCEGVTVCLGAEGEVCQAPIPEPERCDFRDNDCDGVIDEDFKQGDAYGVFDHCGTCGASCDSGFPNAASTSCQVTNGQAQCVVDTCAEGYSKLNAYQCIPDGVSLCSPCASDENCLGEGAACVELDAGSFCGRACTGAGGCPDGYICEDVGADADQCVPSTGSCGCDGSNTDLSRTCSETFTPDDPDQPATTCNGIERCTADGWGGCELPADICDGLDNDCNGQTDEDFRDAEGRYYTVQHCGACGNSCAALDPPNAQPVCDLTGEVPTCSFACEGDWRDVDGLSDNGCECLPQPGPDLAGDGIDSNCDGIDGELHGAIFVAKNGFDAAPGTREEPLLTIGAAIDRAFQEGKTDVYVATGVYSESVELVDGIGLFGGYSSDFFRHDTVTFETAIIGQDPTAALPGAVTARDLGVAGAPEPTVLDGFTIFGANAANVAGANSYGIYVRNAGSQLLVRNNRIFGGAGGNGASGSGGGDGTDGADAQAGVGVEDVNAFESDGLRRCSNAEHANDGGTGGQTTCSDGTNTSGGAGGGGLCPLFGEEPTASEVGASGSGTSPGTGGFAGWDQRIDTGFNCGLCNTPAANPYQAGFGTPGGAGEDGSGGDSCADPTGEVVDGHWVGGRGAGGDIGAHGSGGGGGGSGGGVFVDGNNCLEEVGGDDIAGTGGGGGAGGCAGTGGTGGEAGGGSFGIFVVFDGGAASYPVLEGNAVRAGKGGQGGGGGPGGVGGSAGSGAPGGAASEGDSQTWCATGGGEGGNGGRGGHGGGGGGACGGVSYGIFASPPPSGAVADDYLDNAFLPGGQGGDPGSGGPALGVSGEGGAPGQATSTNF